MLTENASRPDLRGYWWVSEPPLVRTELADQALRTPDRQRALMADER